MVILAQAGISEPKANNDISQLYQDYRNARSNEDSLAQAIDALNTNIRNFSNWMLKDVPDSDKTISKLKDIRDELSAKLINCHDQSGDAFMKYKDAFTSQYIHKNVNNLIDNTIKDPLDDHKVAVLKP